jgi:Fic/DOC family
MALNTPFNLNDFMRESNRIEGIHRQPTEEEIAATARFLSRADVITISDLVDLVAVYQPDARPRFAQGLDVRVGNHFPPKGGPHVQVALQALLDKAAPRNADAYRAHVEYETLHPFTDGNGRSGRALWLWMMGGIHRAPLGFLHHFYYQALQHAR